VTTEEKVDRLRDAYAGSLCVLITCGPSLGLIDHERLKASLSGVLTIAVKQAGDIVPDQADFLCFNSFNVARFHARGVTPIRAFAAEPTGRVPQLNRWDIRFPTNGTDGDLQSSLAVRRNFDDFLLSKTMQRPWGPGIVYELGLYLAVHLGVSELIAIGWDIANERGHNTHYYDSRTEDPFFDRGRADAYRMVGVRRHLPGALRDSIRWGRALVSHRTGRLYNRTTMVPGEAEVVASSTKPARAWLQTHGVELGVVASKSMFDPAVPRLSHDELWDRLAAARR
jgi:hypothetical protein